MVDDKQNRHKVVIIGSGPAGLTAAIYTARALLQPLVIEGAEPGGQLMITTEIENYPGFPDAISGPQLIQNMRRQAEHFGTQFVNNYVESVDLGSRPFPVKTSSDELFADALIIASGASANWLGLESEQRLRGKGVSACATCDGFFFKDKKVLVIGGGDSAIEEALFLTKFASQVTIVHRRNQLRASKIMQEKAFANSKINFIWDSVVDDILDVNQNKVVGARLKNRKTGKIWVEPCDGVFLAIGHTPNTQIFKGQLEMDARGYIITQGKSSKTSVEGVFAAGDVQDSSYRQAITAAASGCIAAIDAERFLAEN
ncbi:thioredoxin-disulfide reductase [candidate division KSB1 bacterium]|nr:MAG: thioredoxin-disulfide reductase [candidate division KSB1 bacterium 4484_219]RKY75551.1 MAG: thioredoxin-disulfide reductase [candidate division KSB1 bacterium]RKY78143.1 MAG: thioredoxin-disulfide reductase [candidate division KSB1 bacterium]RKY91619.1 MAG: thioredoxin-disulfide reductase [candidate division KSB1 bacterium]HDI52258.1 thioredoxin-disulfide reductase [Bacteroidota bacterium]